LYPDALIPGGCILCRIVRHVTLAVREGRGDDQEQCQGCGRVGWWKSTEEGSPFIQPLCRNYVEYNNKLQSSI
jgi:hypothetical protein